MSTLPGTDASIRFVVVGLFLSCATPPKPAPLAHQNASESSESPNPAHSFGSIDRQPSNAAKTGGINDLANACPVVKKPGHRPPRRLSKIQYTNTILDLARWLAPAESPKFFAELQKLLAKFPDDLRVSPTGDARGGYRRFDQSVQDTHVAMNLAIANAVAKQMTSTGKRLNTTSKGCLASSESNPDECLSKFIQEFGFRSLRHPLSESDVEFYRKQLDSAPSLTIALKFRRIIVALLTSPELFYMFEHGDPAVDPSGGPIPLSSFELASRLSYHFWQTLPDDSLLQAAKDGSLLQPNVFRNHVHRLFQDKRSEATLADFTRDWLWLDEVPHLDTLIGTPVYDAFLSGFVPDKALRDAMVNEIIDLFVYFTRNGGIIEDVLGSARSFAKSKQLAELYGVRPWNGEDQPPTFGNPHRVGLFTRAAFLSSGLTKTRPIMKGIFLRKALLCESIPMPPASANSVSPEIAKHLTTRELVETLTEQPGSGCDFCHADTINPLGFITENFDSIGRYRTHERLFDQEGNLIEKKRVNTTTRPFLEGLPPTTMAGPRELTMALVRSGKPQICFVENYYRFTYGSRKSDDHHACEMNVLFDMVKQGSSLEEILQAAVFFPAFKFLD